MMIELQSNTLLRVEKLVDGNPPKRAVAQLTLSYDLRQKSRQRATLDTGEDVGVFLPHGTVLHNGDLLEAENGLVIEVKSAQEALCAAITNDPQLLLRACYHLGNRHVPVQIKENRVSYRQDYVLDDMLRGLGLEVLSYTGTFEPESGAYHSNGHGHHHHS
jgi:urease accessory protein